jgi:4-oxalocrotonate tautomerase
MPIVRIELKQGRPQEVLHRLIDGVTQVMSETLDMPKENVQVLVYEVPQSLWGRGGSPKDLHQIS